MTWPERTTRYRRPLPSGCRRQSRRQCNLSTPCNHRCWPANPCGPRSAALIRTFMLRAIRHQHPRRHFHRHADGREAGEKSRAFLPRYTHVTMPTCGSSNGGTISRQIERINLHVRCPVDQNFVRRRLCHAMKAIDHRVVAMAFRSPQCGSGCVDSGRNFANHWRAPHHRLSSAAK